MGFSITSVEHALAVAGQDVVKGAQAVDSFLKAALAKGQVAEPIVESLTALADPQAVPFERAAFAALGLVAKAAGDTDAATAAKGLSIPLDEATYNDFKAVYQALASKAGFLLAGSASTAPTK
jgi:hypothetical protein